MLDLFPAWKYFKDEQLYSSQIQLLIFKIFIVIFSNYNNNHKHNTEHDLTT
jgi:hypothetical protein